MRYSKRPRKSLSWEWQTPHDPIDPLSSSSISRRAEIDLYACVDLQVCVQGHLSSLIPSQRSTQLLRQGDDRARDSVAHRPDTMSREYGSVLHASLVAMARHARQVQQQGEARRALHQGADRGTTKTQDEARRLHSSGRRCRSADFRLIVGLVGHLAGKRFRAVRIGPSLNGCLFPTTAKRMRKLRSLQSYVDGPPSNFASFSAVGQQA
jgi:hypothetical protein